MLSFFSCKKDYTEPVKQEVVSSEIKKPIKKIKNKKKFKLNQIFSKKNSILDKK